MPPIILYLALFTGTALIFGDAPELRGVGLLMLAALAVQWIDDATEVLP